MPAAAVIETSIVVVSRSLVFRVLTLRFLVVEMMISPALPDPVDVAKSDPSRLVAPPDVFPIRTVNAPDAVAAPSSEISPPVRTMLPDVAVPAPALLLTVEPVSGVCVPNTPPVPAVNVMEPLVGLEIPLAFPVFKF